MLDPMRACLPEEGEDELDDLFGVFHGDDGDDAFLRPGLGPLDRCFCGAVLPLGLMCQPAVEFRGDWFYCPACASEIEERAPTLPPAPVWVLDRLARRR